jgi:hypothetical protein
MDIDSNNNSDQSKCNVQQSGIDDATQNQSSTTSNASADKRPKSVKRKRARYIPEPPAFFAKV